MAPPSSTLVTRDPTPPSVPGGRPSQGSPGGQGGPIREQRELTRLGPGADPEEDLATQAHGGATIPTPSPEQGLTPLPAGPGALGPLSLL